MFPRRSFCEPEESRGEYDAVTDAHSFFSLSANMYYELNLPEAFDCCLSGSPYGGIVLCNRPQMEIFNPITHVSLPLPLLTTVEGYDNLSAMHYLFEKIVVAISPSYSPVAPVHERFIVLATLQREGRSVFARPGDKAWSSIDIPVGTFDDILLLHNQVFVIDKEGMVTQFDLISHRVVATEYGLSEPGAIPFQVDFEFDHFAFYIVEILGELYIVEKIHIFENYRGAAEDDDLPFENCFLYSFIVFKLDLGTWKREEVFTLGGYAIFVGYTSFSSLASEHPESKSCIYFTDHHYGEIRRSGDTGIFNLETKKLEGLVPTGYIGKLYSPPFWFIPNFWKADTC